MQVSLVKKHLRKVSGQTGASALSSLTARIITSLSGKSKVDVEFYFWYARKD